MAWLAAAALLLIGLMATGVGWFLPKQQASMAVTAPATHSHGDRSEPLTTPTLRLPLGLAQASSSAADRTNSWTPPPTIPGVVPGADPIAAPAGPTAASRADTPRVAVEHSSLPATFAAPVYPPMRPATPTPTRMPRPVPSSTAAYPRHAPPPAAVSALVHPPASPAAPSLTKTPRSLPCSTPAYPRNTPAGIASS